MISSNPRISIVTPFYNTGIIFQETIASIYNQTFTDWEWIIIDDGTCNEDAILQLDTLKNANDNRVKIVKNGINKGLPSARNKGISNSKARFVFFIDSDDLIDPTTIEKFYIFLSANREFHYVNSYVKGFGDQQYDWTGGFHEQKLFLKENRNTSCFMARKEVFNEVFFDETMREGCEDWDFWIHSASKNFWGYTIPEFLFHYRRSDNSRWATLQGKETLRLIQKTIKKKYHSVIKQNGFPAPVFEPYKFGVFAPALPVCDVKSNQVNTLLCIFPWLKLGGVDKFNLDLLAGLKAKGWDIVILTTLGSDHPWQKYFAEITSEIFHIDTLTVTHKQYVFIEYFINSRKPSALFISNSMYGYQILPYISKKFPSLFIADYTHCEEPEWHAGGYPFYSAVYSEYINKTFVTSEHLKRWGLQNGSAPQKTEVCYIGVDTNLVKKNEEERNRIRTQLNLSEATSLILFVGRLTEQKQPAVLAKSLQLLAERFQDFKCVVIGNGPDESLLRKLIKLYRLEKKVILCGGLPNENVLKYMDAADIFFLPSAYEGIALSIYEAMAKGLPVVGADVGGQEELVDATSGYLVKPSIQSAQSLEYSRLLELLCKDPAKAKEMGAAGRKRVEGIFPLQNAIDQFDLGLKHGVAKKGLDIADTIESRSEILLINQLRHLQLQEESWGNRMQLMTRYKAIITTAKRLHSFVKRISN